jgi:hypothetical protein
MDHTTSIILFTAIRFVNERGVRGNFVVPAIDLNFPKNFVWREAFAAFIR